MAQGDNVYRRIRNIKHSLENAEQSFLDNKGIRGELDLMLAEAELNNLRRKKDVPWNWSRQLLALCAASMLALAGFGGWYYAEHDGREDLPSEQINSQNVPVSSIDEAAAGSVAAGAAAEAGQNQAQDVPPPAAAASSETAVSKDHDIRSGQMMLPEADMRKLIRSARTELTNAN